MPFENEFSSYEVVRRLMESEKVKELHDRLRIRNTGNDEVTANEALSIAELEQSNWVPDMILGIDGGFHAVPVENGFPGAEFGYVTVASVLILANKIRELEQDEIIDPRKYRETEKGATIDAVFPGCNVILDSEPTSKASMRKALFEELNKNRVFDECESLLETYEHLLKIKIDGEAKLNDKERHRRKPMSPIEGVNKRLDYGFGQYVCPHSGQALYSSDAMRLHELLKSNGSSGEMYGQIMSTLEKLWLIHILRAFEAKNWLPTLRRMAFVLDGPLAVFSTASWLTKAIIHELARINEKQKAINGSDLLILGIEKSGTFVNHFTQLDTSRNGREGLIKNTTAILLDDKYIKRNIIFSESKKAYGLDTYFGRKFFYKNSYGYRIVSSLAFFNQYQGDISTANIDQFPRLADAIHLLDTIISSSYPNSVTPLIAAHAEASIPLNLGKKIFEDIANQIKNTGVAATQ
jgi:hypothetical protein